jgi:hypothetical protein
MRASGKAAQLRLAEQWFRLAQETGSRRDSGGVQSAPMAPRKPPRVSPHALPVGPEDLLRHRAAASPSRHRRGCGKLRFNECRRLLIDDPLGFGLSQGSARGEPQQPSRNDPLRLIAKPSRIVGEHEPRIGHRHDLRRNGRPEQRLRGGFESAPDCASALMMHQQGEQNDDRDRNAKQPEKNQTHDSLRSSRSLSPVVSRTDHSFPGPITELATFDRGEAGGKRADEHGCGEPQG